MSALFTRRRFQRVIRALRIAFGAWFALCCALAIGIVVYGLTDRAQPADVIIVLGAGLNDDLSPGTALIRRATHAAELWKANDARQIICAGGFAIGMTRSEADGCAQVLRENGVPADVITVEDGSRSTEENALYAHQIMRARGWNSALVVSDGYHLLRATWIFSTEGIAFTTSPAVPPPFTELIGMVVREVVGLHWQVVKTLLGLPVTYVPWW